MSVSLRSGSVEITLSTDLQAELDTLLRNLASDAQRVVSGEVEAFAREVLAAWPKPGPDHPFSTGDTSQAFSTQLRLVDSGQDLYIEGVLRNTSPDVYFVHVPNQAGRAMSIKQRSALRAKYGVASVRRQIYTHAWTEFVRRPHEQRVLRLVEQLDRVEPRMP